MNKYRAQKTVVDGIKFDSKKEARRYQELKLMERTGEITRLSLQTGISLHCGQTPIKIRSKGYPNGRHAVYRADFTYFHVPTEEFVIEDVKGMDTPLSRLKRAIIEAQTGIQVKIIK